MTVTTADIEAATDVVKELCEQADQMGVVDSVEARDALGALAAAVRRAQAMVTGQAASLLEQPQTIDGHRYVRSDEYKRRFDHDRIAKMIEDRAIADRNGEIRDARSAARNAVALTRKIYLSDSSEAKVGALRHYLGVGDVIAENVASDQWSKADVRVFPIEEE